MKTLRILLPLSLGILVTSHAEKPTPDQYGFARVVSAVGLETPTRITLGPVDLLKGNPVPPGGSSGVITLWAGETTLEVTNEACDPPVLKSKVQIPGAGTVGIVVYHQFKEVDGELVPELKFSKLSESEKRDKPQLSVVSLSAKPQVAVKVGSQVALLDRQRAREFEAKLEQTVSIESNGTEIENVEMRQNGHYVVFLFDDLTNNGLKAVAVHFMKYEAEPQG